MKVAENDRKLRRQSEQKGERRLAGFCRNLLLFSGLARLRQDLANLVPRLEGRRSIQLSYGRTEELTLILKHFPIFCPFLIMVFGLNRALTVHLFVQYAYWTLTVQIGSTITGVFSPARRSSFSKASRFIFTN